MKDQLIVATLLASLGVLLSTQPLPGQSIPQSSQPGHRWAEAVRPTSQHRHRAARQGQLAKYRQTSATAVASQSHVSVNTTPIVTGGTVSSVGHIPSRASFHPPAAVAVHGSLPGHAAAMNVLPPTHLHAHEVIRAPSLEEYQRLSTNGSSKNWHHRSPHPPLLSYHHPVQPPPARLPQANQRPTWKSPYSYGYFGASSTRHWNLHFGFRDRYTEWRLK